MEEGCSEYLGYLILGFTVIPRKEEEREQVTVSFCTVIFEFNYILNKVVPTNFTPYNKIIPHTPVIMLKFESFVPCHLMPPSIE